MNKLINEVQKREFNIIKFLPLNIFLTCLAILPSLLISITVLVIGTLFFNYVYNTNPYRNIIEGLALLLMVLVWSVSIIFSIQGLRQKSSAKIKSLYIILSFISVLIVIKTVLWPIIAASF